MTVALAALGLSFLLGVLLTPAAGWLARRCGILRPAEGGGRAARPTVPVAGGPVLLTIAAIVPAVFAWTGLAPNPAGADWWGGLAAAAVICTVGVIDDWRGLRGRWKLLGQVAAVSVAV